MKATIIDNFLDEDIFEKIYKMLLMENNGFPWYYSGFVSDENDIHRLTLKNDIINSRYFHHNFYLSDEQYGIKWNKNFYNILKPFLEQLNISELLRIKTNLFPSTHKVYQHPFHRDYLFPHQGAILYMNTCDGGTCFEDGTMVESVANRVLFFDSSIPHASTTCTNDKCRVNINVNFIGK